MTARRALLRGRLALRRLLRFGLRGPPGGFSLFGLLLHFLRQLLPGLQHLACQLLQAVAGAGADAGLLSPAPAEVIEVRPADPPPPHDLDALQPRRVQQERPLHADAVGDAAYREVGVDAASPLADDHALERLHALPFSLHDTGHDAHRIAGAEVGNLRVLLEWNDRFQVHGNLAHFTVRPPEGQATPAPPPSAPPRPGGPGGAPPSAAGSAAAATSPPPGGSRRAALPAPPSRGTPAAACSAAPPAGRPRTTPVPPTPASPGRRGCGAPRRPPGPSPPARRRRA